MVAEMAHRLQPWPLADFDSRDVRGRLPIGGLLVRGQNRHQLALRQAVFYIPCRAQYDATVLQESVFTRKGVDRILKYAFELAQRWPKKHLSQYDRCGHGGGRIAEIKLAARGRLCYSSPPR